MHYECLVPSVVVACCLVALETLDVGTTIRVFAH